MMDDFRNHAFRASLKAILNRRFLSKDFPELPDPMKAALVLDSIEEIVSLVELNFVQESDDLADQKTG